MLNYLPFLLFAVLMVTMGVICRRYLRRVKAADAKHGLTISTLVTLQGVHKSHREVFDCGRQSLWSSVAFDDGAEVAP